MGFPGCTSGKEPARQHRRHKRQGFNPWVRKISWRRAWQPTPVFLPRESPRAEKPGGLQSIASQSQKESDMTEVTEHACTQKLINYFSRIQLSTRFGADLSPLLLLSPHSLTVKGQLWCTTQVLASGLSTHFPCSLDVLAVHTALRKRELHHPKSSTLPWDIHIPSNWSIQEYQGPVPSFLVVQMIKNLPAIWEAQVQSLGWEDPLEERRATHSSILAWRIPWTRSLAGYISRGHKESDMTERLTQHPSPQFRTLSKGFVKLQSFLWHQLRALLKLYHSSTLFLPNPTSQTSVVPIRLLQNLLHTNLCLRVDSLEPDLPGLKPREEKSHWEIPNGYFFIPYPHLLFHLRGALLLTATYLYQGWEIILNFIEKSGWGKEIRNNAVEQ